MTNQDETGQLTIKQKQALELLLTGASLTEVAEKVGVARQTVSVWHNRDTRFIAELNRRRKELWVSNQDKLRQLVSDAVDVLADEMHGTDLHLRHKAAVAVLKAVGLSGADLTPRGEDNPLAIATTLTRYEEVVALEAAMVSNEW